MIAKVSNFCFLRLGPVMGFVVLIERTEIPFSLLAGLLDLLYNLRVGHWTGGTSVIA